MKRKTNGKEPENKRGHANKNSKCIAHHVGAIIKSRLHIQGLTANRAALIHLHKISEDESTLPGLRSAPGYGAWILLWHQHGELCTCCSYLRGHVCSLALYHWFFFS